MCFMFLNVLESRLTCQNSLNIFSCNVNSTRTEITTIYLAQICHFSCSKKFVIPETHQSLPFQWATCLKPNRTSQRNFNVTVI